MMDDDKHKTTLLERVKPSAGKRTLILLSGLFWIVAGGILLARAWQWVFAVRAGSILIPVGAGFAGALVIHHFGFLKVVDKNLGRIARLRDRTCVFAFQSLKSYIMVAIMISLGIAIRLSPLPKIYVATIYIAIGTALVLSSVRYLRVGLK